MVVNKSPKEYWMDAHDSVLEELGLDTLNGLEPDARDDIEAAIENRFQELISNLIDNHGDFN